MDKEDSIIGDLELYGDVLDMDDETHRMVNVLFNEMDVSVSVEEFDRMLRELAEKIGQSS